MCIQEGVADLKCSSCSDGFHSLSPQGCTPCFCSNRTNQCSAEMNFTTSDPQEICDCPFPFSGSSCETCLPEYYFNGTSRMCQRCNCNGRAEMCADGSGECIVSTTPFERMNNCLFVFRTAVAIQLVHIVNCAFMVHMMSIHHSTYLVSFALVLQ